MQEYAYFNIMSRIVVMVVIMIWLSVLKRKVIKPFYV